MGQNLSQQGVLTDKNGILRTQGFSYDLGAYEYFAPLSLQSSSIENKYFSIYPNPVTGKNFLNLNTLSEPQQIQIYNSIGQQIKQMVVSQSVNIDISDLTNGTYFIRLKNNLGTIKFIMQR